MNKNWSTTNCHRCYPLRLSIKDVKFGIHIGPDCPTMGQIWAFLRSVSVYFDSHLGHFTTSFSTFWLTEPKCTETGLKRSQICPILYLDAKSDIPGVRHREITEIVVGGDVHGCQICSQSGSN